MFYSETLLSKTGPLARVWLAANIERKLTKSNIIQSDIGSSVNAIVDQGQAPMALRLSGQLLLGVVRIYSRKARYLLDDCNEALMKIKMAFRPGNVDLPANQSHAVNPATLTLPDVITELDLLAPMPDPDLLLAEPSQLDRGAQDPTLLDFGTSQFLSESIERREEPEPQFFDDGDDLGLDFGEGPSIMDMSIERGRDAPAARTLAEEFEDNPSKFDDAGDLGLDFGEEPLAPVREESLAAPEDVEMGGISDLGVQIEEDEGIQIPPEDEAGPGRETLSPLSDLRPSVERELERTFVPEDTTIAEVEDEFAVHAQRAKRRRVLPTDAETELHAADIRAQQNDRSKILKPTSYLPRDPILLALMTMQQSGGFVSNILGDGRMQGWAPELRGVLSVEVVRRSGELKRKRDSGVADLEDMQALQAAGKTPELEFEQEEDFGVAPGALDLGGETTLGAEGGEEELPLRAPSEELGDDAMPPPIEEDESLSPPPDNFDDTTMPLLHPAETGPISQGTQHAVHLLRDQFGEAAAEDSAERQRSSVKFQDLLPEDMTNRADATKMFFEVLVLATKDAIKVEQSTKDLGGPIRIRAKRGLWGAWAETSAGGEIASQEAGAATAAVTA